jgi:gliding motility-associated-like protein
MKTDLLILYAHLMLNSIPSFCQESGLNTADSYFTIEKLGSFGTFAFNSKTLLTNEVSDFPEIVLGTTPYYVVEELNGCIGPFSLVNITFQGCMIAVPTAFTPDGDLTTDHWELNEIFPKNVVSVYNRWGEQLYRSDAVKYASNPWDGTYKEKTLPVGSYYFIIELNEDNMDPLKGIVSIVLP